MPNHPATRLGRNRKLPKILSSPELPGAGITGLPAADFPRTYRKPSAPGSHTRDRHSRFPGENRIEIAEGYEASMPAFAGVIPEQDVEHLVAYLKGLK